MNGKKVERHVFFIWGIIGLLALALLWKIITTPFELDFSVFISFLLALFAIGISLFYYVKMNAMFKEIKEFIERHQSDKRAASVQAEAIEPEEASEEQLDPTIQLKFEEQTLKLKEEERKELLERLIHRAGLDEQEKKVYISQFEKVEDDLFNIRSNINQLRKKINQSFSEMFILEKTKVVRDIIKMIGHDIVIQESFAEINERFNMVKNDIPKSSMKLLIDQAYIGHDGNLTRKGYREFIKTAKKMY